MSSTSTRSLPPTDLELFLDHAEGLIWSLLDGEISEEGLCELEALVSEHLDVRESYLNCVTLHSDLTEHFSEPAPEETQTPTAEIRALEIVSTLNQRHPNGSVTAPNVSQLP